MEELKTDKYFIFKILGRNNAKVKSCGQWYWKIDENWNKFLKFLENFFYKVRWKERVCLNKGINVCDKQEDEEGSARTEMLGPLMYALAYTGILQ